VRCVLSREPLAVVSLTIARWPLWCGQLRHRGSATYTTRWDATTHGGWRAPNCTRSLASTGGFPTYPALPQPCSLRRGVVVCDLETFGVVGGSRDQRNCHIQTTRTPRCEAACWWCTASPAPRTSTPCPGWPWDWPVPAFAVLRFDFTRLGERRRLRGHHPVDQPRRPRPGRRLPGGVRAWADRTGRPQPRPGRRRRSLPLCRRGRAGGPPRPSRSGRARSITQPSMVAR
jgi:hypothetical protein